MSDIKPWMRRASHDLTSALPYGAFGLSREQAMAGIAEAIAAHAPPAEEMMEALSIAGMALATTRKRVSHKVVRDALALYDSWLHREEGYPK